jgi:hypothetical protein
VHLKPPNKRTAADTAQSTDSKRKKTGMSNDSTVRELSPTQQEALLRLPICLDEELIGRASLYCNRAPLLLAFTIELLRYTMPEQPGSSRLSMGQAVVSANSRTKAIRLGLEKPDVKVDDLWLDAQPKVTIMGRQIAILKRGDYRWQDEETVVETQDQTTKTDGILSTESQSPVSKLWSASHAVSLKKSTFVARVVSLEDPSQASRAMSQLMKANMTLKSATHNAWAYRVNKDESTSQFGGIAENSADDGETGCGVFLLRLMRAANSVNILIVLSRWYGGVLLGPDRWRIMQNCVHDALFAHNKHHGKEDALGGEALWALDPVASSKKGNARGAFHGGNISTDDLIGAAIHHPEAARDYLLKSFASVTGTGIEHNKATGKGYPLFSFSLLL